ncbi:hypothetical protein UFVDC4_00055 [Staphylococcus phage vB_SauM-UFV_DC4]|nr:hypothetical protein UFVDC4_00055 [Staphylococcus phage vB_SauM-UFV_DC4]BDE75626.1 hypothetical protein [Staphylococcus phage S6]
MTEEKLPALNIIASAVTTTPKTNTEFINMTFMVDNPKFKDMYLEFSDIDLSEVFKNEMLKEAYENGQLAEYTKIDQTLDNYNIRMIKDDTVIQIQRIRDYFEELSEYADKLIFWVDEITLWSQLIELVYGGSSDNTYELPSYIDFQPIDIKSVVRMSAIRDNDYSYAEELMGTSESLTDSSLSISSFLLTFIKNAGILK